MKRRLGATIDPPAETATEEEMQLDVSDIEYDDYPTF